MIDPLHASLMNGEHQPLVTDEPVELKGRLVKLAGAKQPVHSFLGGNVLGIQQGTCVWVGSPKSLKFKTPRKLLILLEDLKHNIIQIHINVPRDWQYNYVKYSIIQVEYE